MKRRLTKLTAAGLAVLALTGCTGGAQEEVSEEPPVPKNVETTWTLVVGQPEGSTCWDAAESFAEALSDATEGAVAVEVQPRPLDRVTSLGRLRPGSWTSIWTAVSYMAPTATKKSWADRFSP
ncbi:MAG: hypothetical protein ACLTYN_06510 [Dysosmobacter welbionis]